jgi:hypothetical protein
MVQWNFLLCCNFDKGGKWSENRDHVYNKNIHTLQQIAPQEKIKYSKIKGFLENYKH